MRLKIENTHVGTVYQMQWGQWDLNLAGKWGQLIMLHL